MMPDTTTLSKISSRLGNLNSQKVQDKAKFVTTTPDTTKLSQTPGRVSSVTSQKVQEKAQFITTLASTTSSFSSGLESETASEQSNSTNASTSNKTSSEKAMSTTYAHGSNKTSSEKSVSTTSQVLDHVTWESYYEAAGMFTSRSSMENLRRKPWKRWRGLWSNNSSEEKILKYLSVVYHQNVTNIPGWRARWNDSEMLYTNTHILKVRDLPVEFHERWPKYVEWGKKTEKPYMPTHTKRQLAFNDTWLEDDDGGRVGAISFIPP